MTDLANLLPEQAWLTSLNYQQETHGREETAALLDGLTILPPKRHSHRGRQIREFDLDAALARR
ncbi:hypothetical protein MJI46_34905, partial [Salmonella enterica subsp. enterica serovar Cerro]|nr:hypothetical protein [Salmonella enterica subsp. enterica serovar Cerro]